MKPLTWRKRIGLVTTSGQVVTEPRYNQIAPEGVTFHTARMLNKGGSLESLAEMEQNAPRAIDELTTAEVDAIAYCCTVSGALRGIDEDQNFCTEVRDRTGIPTTSTMLACVEALQHLNALKVVLVSPYLHSHNEHEAEYLAAAGIHTVSMRGMNLTSGKQYSRVPIDQIAQFSLDAWTDEADAMLISCMNYDAIGAAEQIEQSIGKPVITSHTATLWRVLSLAGVADRIPGVGRLLMENR